MAFFAEASIETSASPERVFDTLADHDSWAAWMPPSFKPASGARPLGRLRRGAKPKVVITANGLALPTKLKVTVADRPREITWCGGVRGVMRAEHRFVLEALPGGGTRIRSIERWTGLVAGVLRPIIKRTAESVGRDQIDAIATEAERDTVHRS